jgi:predicted 3-demethylubiquinone-9 3-methyltransferase (glyoxalase superfamily)
MNRIAPVLWFEHQAEEAATFYVEFELDDPKLNAPLVE